MPKLKYFDPNTFEENEVEIDQFVIDIADKIHTSLIVEDGYLKTKIILSDTPNTMRFGIMGPREIGAPSADKYRITIEKLPPNEIS